ncbi:SDR family oxidoreductase [Sulfidibacter corallicola]|uniref:SDR family oxidoreductase n=1 Tax=Sulfidibacter corallicola TaxID=2818388 RepID=A0A8A4TWY0_SULCO|nr:SDR family oxidoreductase [Sulfidibacter corallicola]QTD53482.1 SDR family oxidoreductase [Sulfidibacter corallicola]
MRFDKILVTGGAGYCGSVLVPRLLEMGCTVTVYDILYYGCDHLPKDHPNLTVVQGDIRDTAALAEAMAGHQAVVHLACISNDASFVLDEALSTSVNLDAFEPMVVAAKRAGIQRFVYASTSSVYGVSDEPDVTEDHPLVPLTLYNKYKGMCEPLLTKHTDEDFVGVIFRPATVCGYGPRQRLDVSVNILTNYAVNKNQIRVFGGSQLRPNLHIQDYVNLVTRLLEAEDHVIADQVFNCGYQNMSIMDIAQTVKQVVEREFPEKGEIAIATEPTDDIRSYHINSDKVKKVLGFEPTLSVEDAVVDLCRAFRDGKLPDSFDDDRYFNVRTMKNTGAR